MLTVNMNYNDGILFIRLKGKLNNDTIKIFEENVLNIIKKAKITNIVFNLEKLDAIDINGINSLIKSYIYCKKNDGCILMCGNKSIKNKLRDTNLLEISNELVALKIFKMRVR